MTQLTKTERKEIGHFKSKGYSMRVIAQMLDRSPSTISRELSRNRVSGEYNPDKAHLKSYQRRYWVDRDLPRLWDKDWKPFRAFLEEKLSLEHPWSLEQIAHSWSIGNPENTISHSTLYRFIDRYEPKLKKFLNHQRYKIRYRKNATKRVMIPNRVWIDDRPKSVDSRLVMGDWEGDTLGSKRGETDNLLGAIERKSRYLLAAKMPNRKPAFTANKLKKWHKKYQFKSLTLDNGIEFKHHEKIGCKTYFCHPYSSWEKGQVEYAMRLLRRLVPKKSSLENITHLKLQNFVDQLNHTPRKCLDWKTPHQVFFHNSTNPLIYN